MRLLGDTIQLPDQDPYGSHRAHRIMVVEVDEVDARIKCLTCGETWWVDRGMSTAGIVTMAVEREKCPHCHRAFYAQLGHDPLKRHIDYCEAVPVENHCDPEGDE